MKPDLKNLQLDLFADADFADIYSTKNKQDPISVKSQRGLLINFGEFSILWSSKLQSEIFLSTLEAEYIILSQEMRELIGRKSLLAELGAQMNF